MTTSTRPSSPRNSSGLRVYIAATAHAHDAALYTRNPDDFRGLDGLDGLVEVVTV